MSESFRTVLIDPPWPERGGGKIKRGADRHYPTLALGKIAPTIEAAPEWRRVAHEAHLYLWVTNNYLPAGLAVMSELGFRYVTNFVWIKGEESLDQNDEARVDLQTGLGQYFRGQHELCLFGVRGDGYANRTERKNIGSVLIERRGAHSAKPPSSYGKIEARSRGPYLELFARSARSGWTSWGNEAPTVEGVLAP